MRGWLACEARYERLCFGGASWESWQRRDPYSGVSLIGIPGTRFVRVRAQTNRPSSISESTTEIASYVRSVDAQSSSSIEGTRPAPVDVTSLWSADPIVISLRATGQLPEQDWIVDVTLKFSGDITYDF